jgi:hypothetical protein
MLKVESAVLGVSSDGSRVVIGWGVLTVIAGIYWQRSVTFQRRDASILINDCNHHQSQPG